MKEITAKEVQEKLNDNEKLYIVDVREDEEVAQGMIPGAHHIPLHEVPDKLDYLDQEKEYIVVCRSGGRSSKAQEFLLSKGIQATNMAGGMLNWEGPTT